MRKAVMRLATAEAQKVLEHCLFPRALPFQRSGSSNLTSCPSCLEPLTSQSGALPQPFLGGTWRPQRLFVPALTCPQLPS